MFPIGYPVEALVLLAMVEDISVKGTDRVTGTATFVCGTSRLSGLPYFCSFCNSFGCNGFMNSVVRPLLQITN